MVFPQPSLTAQLPTWQLPFLATSSVGDPGPACVNDKCPCTDQTFLLTTPYRALIRDCPGSRKDLSCGKPNVELHKGKKADAPTPLLPPLWKTLSTCTQALSLCMPATAVPPPATFCPRSQKLSSYPPLDSPWVLGAKLVLKALSTPWIKFGRTPDISKFQAPLQPSPAPHPLPLLSLRFQSD